VNLIWIALGCIIDWIGILLLTAHLCAVLAALGFDPILIGVIFCMNMQISYISPPFGPAAFLFQEPRRPISPSRTSSSRCAVHGHPCLCARDRRVVPEIALWLPRTMLNR